MAILSITKLWAFWEEGVSTAKYTESLAKEAKIQRKLGSKIGIIVSVLVCFGPSLTGIGVVLDCIKLIWGDVFLWSEGSLDAMVFPPFSGAP